MEMGASGGQSGEGARGDCSPELQAEADKSDARVNQNHLPAQRRTQSDEASSREDASSANGTQKRQNPTGKVPGSAKIDIRLLVRRREAGALIGKQGANIKRMRDQYKSSSFNIPDTGNGPERIVSISSESWSSLESILLEISRLFLSKHCALNSSCDDQVELKQLINSAYAGLLIGMGGQSIRKLRNDSKAAIKIYEMCCPGSEERVCAIKARPPVVVATIRMIHELMLASQASIKVPLVAQKPYDALNFDSHQVDKYGGHLVDDCGPVGPPAPRCSMSLLAGLAADGQAHDQHYHQHHYFQHSNTQRLIHFDALSRADVEPIPLVVSSPVMFRPGAFLSPVHALNLAPLHPLANGHQFMSFQARKSWPRFGRPPLNQPPPPPLTTTATTTASKLGPDNIHRQQTFTALPSAVQLFRSQRFHPYESQTRVRSAERAINHQATAAAAAAAAFMHRSAQNQFACADRSKQQLVSNHRGHLNEQTHSKLMTAGASKESAPKSPSRHDDCQ